MTAAARRSVRCAIYTRVSTESGLDQDFNSLDAQYDAAQAYIRSQAHAGWTLVRGRYDDGGFSGGSTDRPALHGSSMTFEPTGSMSLSSTRSIG
jgi:site-specific DNA recombinase